MLRCVMRGQPTICYRVFAMALRELSEISDLAYCAVFHNKNQKNRSSLCAIFQFRKEVMVEQFRRAK